MNDKSMEDKLQIIAIGEACGWIWHGDSSWEKDPNAFYWKNEEYVYSKLPDYLNSLDAMNQAWKKLNVKQATLFANIIGDVMLDYGCGDFRPNMYMLALLVNANARQRAESFLRTLNLWIAK